ncbi:MAG: 50S ribosomal protein L2 [Methanobacteriota archaeon]|nr:MAG: 50S ribosomal protein L2 [Euryarchaeota archaeon]
MGKRIIPRRRGRGHRWKAPDNRFKGDARHPRSKSSNGKVIELLHDPGRTAPLAKISDQDGTYTMIAFDGMHVGQDIAAGHGAEIDIGNTSYVGSIPEGTKVYNIEMQPGDGGKMARAAGEAATIISHGKQTTTIRLPSKAQKKLDNMCRATIGSVAGSGRGEKPIAKAGKNFYRTRSRPKVWPKVRGVAMNAVDHPHGSGRKQTVGVQSTVSRNAPPGRKVGHIAAKRTGGKR